MPRTQKEKMDEFNEKVQAVLDALMEHGYNAKQMEVTGTSDFIIRILPLDYAKMAEVLATLRVELIEAQNVLQEISDISAKSVKLNSLPITALRTIRTMAGAYFSLEDDYDDDIPF